MTCWCAEPGHVSQTARTHPQPSTTQPLPAQHVLASDFTTQMMTKTKQNSSPGYLRLSWPWCNIQATQQCPTQRRRRPQQCTAPACPASPLCRSIGCFLPSDECLYQEGPVVPTYINGNKGNALRSEEHTSNSSHL